MLRWAQESGPFILCYNEHKRMALLYCVNGKNTKYWDLILNYDCGSILKCLLSNTSFL